MVKARLFYGSTTGNTRAVAEILRVMLGDHLDRAENVVDARPEDFVAADVLILCASTWDHGQLQEDWRQFLPGISSIDLAGKKIALVGLGDANGFSGLFVNGMALLHDALAGRGATLIGQWPVHSYDFRHSNAVRDGLFVGLVIDQENQSDLTFGRLSTWCDIIRPHLSEDTGSPPEDMMGSDCPPTPARPFLDDNKSGDLGSA